MKKRNNRIRSMRGTDYILMTVVYSSVILLTLTILLPFIIIFFQSVTPQEAMIGSQYTLLWQFNVSCHCWNPIFIVVNYNGRLYPLQAISSLPQVFNLSCIYPHDYWRRLNSHLYGGQTNRIDWLLMGVYHSRRRQFLEFIPDAELFLRHSSRNGRGGYDRRG